MGFEFTIHHDLRIVYKKVWGVYDDEASRQAHTEWDVINTEGDIVVYDEFQDLTEVTSYGVSIEQIRRLANRYTDLTEGHETKRIAYVAPSALAFGTGRVYGTLMDTTAVNFHVFTTCKDAAEWLELADEDLARILTRRSDSAGGDDGSSGSASD